MWFQIEAQVQPRPQTGLALQLEMIEAALDVGKAHAGIVLVQGAEPARDTLAKAVAENIPVLGTDLSGFEVVGKIYNLLKAKTSRAASDHFS